MRIRILLADDHVMIRQGLRAIIEREDLEVVGEASDGQEAVRLAQQQHPDVAVLDLSMPLLNGLDAARGIIQASPKTKIIILTMYTEDQYVMEALRAGVRGYVLKKQAPSDLIQAIKEVYQGTIYLSPGVSRALVEAYLAKSELPPDPLTARERQVLQLVSEGRTTKEIASLLEISVKTAESHRTRIMDKLDIHSTASLVRYAVRRGLIQA